MPALEEIVEEGILQRTSEALCFIGHKIGLPGGPNRLPGLRQAASALSRLRSWGRPLRGCHSSTRGSWLLMCTDLTLSAVEIVRLYSLRFKFEHSFKQATRQIGAFAYRF
jgi:hypothetical protein